MATLVHYIQPWMQKSISKEEDNIEKRVAKRVEHHIQVVHKYLDAFEQRVLERPSLTIDLTTI